MQCLKEGEKKKLHDLRVVLAPSNTHVTHIPLRLDKYNEQEETWFLHTYLTREVTVIMKAVLSG